ncbi:hypothetical protein PIROE2DRAFT_12512 [Piromyces sp. E2]|nr:hypothetical protein PIROE2DRAFT_12512 [Piromyces sp. E2]|eukprot:OUM61461.1 hypothetical protein PIROE2DRAFT_12512 [Piromyces sp. E2]
MDETVELQSDFQGSTGMLNNNPTMPHSSSFSNITIKTNLSAIEATNKALEKSVVSPGEYPSFPPPQPKGSKGNLSKLSKSYSSNMINSINLNQNMQRAGSQLKYDVESTDNDPVFSKNNITFDPATQLQINGTPYCKLNKSFINYD